MVKDEIVSHPLTILSKLWPEWNGTNVTRVLETLGVTRVLETLVITSLDYGQDVKFIHD